MQTCDWNLRRSCRPRGSPRRTRARGRGSGSRRGRTRPRTRRRLWRARPAARRRAWSPALCRASAARARTRRRPRACARRVVDQLRRQAAVGAEHGDARARGGARDLRAHPAAAFEAAAPLVMTLISALAHLALDVLALVANALALVRLGRALLADDRGGLADELLGDALDDHPRRLGHFELDALRRLRSAPGGSSRRRARGSCPSAARDSRRPGSPGASHSRP